MNQEPSLPGQGITVLVADDTLNIVTVLTSVLELRGYDVISTNNGKTALEMIRARRPQVALLDIVMPGMDGMALCNVVKDDPELAATLVIMITSITQDSDIPDALWRKGTRADDFVTKPFDPFELADRIERHCQQRGLARPADEV